MSHSSLPATTPPVLWPLTPADGTGSLAIAGRSLAAWQAASWPGGSDVEQTENAWVDPEDARRLAESPAPAVLVTPAGELLARTPGAAADAATLTAGPSSFLLLYPWDILRLNELLVSRLDRSDIRGDLSPHAHIDGTLVLGEGSRVLPGVYIEGKVIVGSNCKIGPNCYIRGNTSIGDHCHIGQAVELKNCLIGSHTNVGHLSYVGDSVLGDHVNFGAGTITSNLRHDGGNHRSLVGPDIIDTGRRKLGAIVGNHTHTGIHTAIYPGRKLGPGSSTRPGAVVSSDLT